MTGGIIKTVASADKKLNMSLNKMNTDVHNHK